MRDLVVLSGSSHPNLTRSICRYLTIEQGVVKSSKFSNGETSIEMVELVREKDVYIVQSGCGDVNDALIELCIMIAACKTASARRVTAVLPLFPYSRQPDVPHAASATGAPSPHGKDQYMFAEPQTPAAGRKPISKAIVTNSAGTLGAVDAFGKTESGYKQWIAQNGTLIANLLTTAGADRCITMDLHDPQFQGFFNIPVDNLYSRPLLKHYIMDFIPDFRLCVIVSPDSGGAKRATSIADNLGCPFALIHKERRAVQAKHPPSSMLGVLSLTANGGSEHAGSMVATTMLVGDVKDRVCVLVDDLVDTSYTITRAAKLLKDQGAKYVYALVTHAILSGDATNRILKSSIDKMIVTNSVPQAEHVRVLGDKLEVLDVSRILAEAIRRIHNGESVSMLFDHGW
jgi:ribose-phosphate pyrophosphokinase